MIIAIMHTDIIKACGGFGLKHMRINKYADRVKIYQWARYLATITAMHTSNYWRYKCLRIDTLERIFQFRKYENDHIWLNMDWFHSSYNRDNWECRLNLEGIHALWELIVLEYDY